MWRTEFKRAEEYADQQLGYAPSRFYQGLIGLLLVAVAFEVAAIYMLVIGDGGAAIAAGTGGILMVSVVIWRVRTWSGKALAVVNDTKHRSVSQAQLMRRWLVVFLIGAVGVTSLGIWSIIEGRTSVGIGYIAIAAAAALLVVVLVEVRRRRP